MNEVPKLFEHLKNVLTDERFLSKELARGEQPFYICPYAAASETALMKMLDQLVEQLDARNIPVLKIDLFALCVEILKSNDDFDWFIEQERAYSKDRLCEELCNVLDVDLIKDAIRERLMAAPHKVVFLTGIGHAYPFLRAHTVLNNLDNVITATPLVMFFPGEYRQTEGSGATLALHGRAHTDGYYRAYNINDCIVKGDLKS